MRPNGRGPGGSGSASARSRSLPGPPAVSRKNLWRPTKGTGITLEVKPGQDVRAGDRLAAGREKLGDRLIADKLAYRFRPPRRGDIVVYRTDDIHHPHVKKGTYYVHRIAGLPGERVHIDPPAVYVNGERVREPAIFDDIAEGRRDYGGYTTAHAFSRPAPFLATDADAIELGDDEYFVLGDNSHASFDGRYFGPLPRRAIVGRAVKIYWPLDRAAIPE
jgi:signal peptidase I